MDRKFFVLAERQARLDARDIRFVHDRELGHLALATGGFALEQMAASGLGAEHLALGGDFEALGDGLARLIARSGLWHGKRGEKLARNSRMARQSFRRHPLSACQRSSLLALASSETSASSHPAGIMPK